MAYKVMAFVQADADLDRLIDYLLQTLQNPVAARNLLDGVEACYDHLSQMPNLYEQCRSPRLKARGYRKAVIHKYIMIYRVDEEKNGLCSAVLPWKAGLRIIVVTTEYPLLQGSSKTGCLLLCKERNPYNMS